MYPALLLVGLIVFALVALYYARQPACSWFHPLTIYLGFHGLVFVIRPILSWYFDYSLIYRVFEFSPDDYAKAMTLVVADVGLVAFAAASLYAGSAPFRNKFDAVAAREAEALARPLWIACILLVPLIAFSLREYWQLRATGMEALELDAATGTTINSSGGNGYAQNAYLIAVTLVPLVAWIGGFRPWTLVLAAASALLLAGAGVRGPVISLLVCLASFHLYARRRRSPDWRIVAIAILGVALFNAVGSDRGYTIRRLVTNEGAHLAYSQPDLAPLEGMDIGNLEFLEYLVDKVPRSTGTYEYFIDNLQIFTEPVPRVLWPGKPIGQPIRLFNLFDYGFPIGMTRSLPGEGWMQLGLAGVVIWCSLCGLLLGWVYNKYALGPQTVVQTALYCALLAMLIVFYRDGMLMTLLKQGLFFLLAPLLLALIARLLGTGRSPEHRFAIPSRRSGSPRRAALASDEAQLRAVPRSRRHPRPPAPAPRG